MAIFQSVHDGQNDRNCGASKRAIAASSHTKCKPFRVRHQATASGTARIRMGANAAGAALYHAMLVKLTAPSCQLRAVRRGTMENDCGLAPVKRPTVKCANSWQIVPARRNRKNAGCSRPNM